MKKVKQLTITLIIALAMPVIALASPPAIPLFVYGDVTIDGQPAPLNTKISAEIDNVEVATATMIKEGIYFVEIPDGRNNVGKTILFKVNGIAVADENYKVVDVNTTPSVKFDLAVITPTPSPAPGGGGGGAPIVQVTPTPTPSPLSEAARVVDTNNDGKIDILDFNTLMVNWASTVADNIADFDNNGKVDIFDFNLLMINWTG